MKNRFFSAISTFFLVPLAIVGFSPSVSAYDAGTVSAWANHSCAIVAWGEVRCWWYAGYMYNSLGGSSRTVSIPSLSGALQVGAGGTHTCAIMDGGGMRCWGNNADGQLGGSSVSTTILATENPTMISLGEMHTCAIVNGGQVRCWGNNADGQLGGSSVSVSVPGILNAVWISAGFNSTYAVLSDGTIKWWGNNAQYQLGATVPGSSSVPLTVPGISGAVSVSTGGSTVCAVLSDGKAKCWGNNADGQAEWAVGIYPATTKLSVPVQVPVPEKILSVSVGGSFACATVEGGNVKCWGGGGSTTPSPWIWGSSPTKAMGTMRRMKGVVSGWGHACAAANTGEVRCWGNNGNHELGDDGWLVVTSVSTNELPGLRFAWAGSASGWNKCGLLANGEVRCWGLDNSSGTYYNAFGGGSMTVSVPGISGAVKIDAGSNFVCVLLNIGGIRCWGGNSLWELWGSSTGSSVNLPGPALDFAIGWSHTCAIVSGEVWCWGYNGQKNLGSGSASPGSSAIPVRVPNISGATRITASQHSTCAIVSGGEVRCWGFDYYGQLGGSSTSVSVPGISGATEISGSGDHTCVILSGGTVRCWGNNDSGQLGVSLATVPTSTPVPQAAVPGISGAVKISSKGNFTCVILSDGTASCWGSSNYEIPTSGPVPVALPFVYDATDLVAGYMDICVTHDAGKLTCMGAGEAQWTLGNNPIRVTFRVLTAAYPPTCSDWLKNQNETSIDYGGICGVKPTAPTALDMAAFTLVLTYSGQTLNVTFPAFSDPARLPLTYMATVWTGLGGVSFSNGAAYAKLTGKVSAELGDYPMMLYANNGKQYETVSVIVRVGNGPPSSYVGEKVFDGRITKISWNQNTTSSQLNDVTRAAYSSVFDGMPTNVLSFRVFLQGSAELSKGKDRIVNVGWRHFKWVVSP